jgi:hypothetical protein
MFWLHPILFGDAKDQPQIGTKTCNSLPAD